MALIASSNRLSDSTYKISIHKALASLDGADGLPGTADDISIHKALASLDSM